MRTQWLHMLILITFLSCGQEEKASQKDVTTIDKDTFRTTPENEDHELSVAVHRAVELKDDLSNLEDFKRSINTFKISFRVLRGSFNDGFIYCEKKLFNQRKKNFISEFNQNGTSSLIINLTEEDQNSTEFNCVAADSSKQHLASINFSLLKSYIFKSTEKSSAFVKGLRSEDKFDYLIMEEDSSFFSEGINLDLNLNTFIALKSTISTFSEDSIKNVPANMNGNNGGNIKINAKKMIGDVHFILKGQNAGKQTNLPDPMWDRPAPDPALNGQCSSREHNRNTSICPGKKGHRGFTGNPGLNGFKGGDSGLLVLETSTLKDVKIKISHRPGLGSEGTPGGAGGPGGDGGLGSKNRFCVSDGARAGGADGAARGYKGMNASCSVDSYPNGPLGDQGLQGPAGKKGADGIIQDSIIKVSHENLEIKIVNDWEN